MLSRPRFLQSGICALCTVWFATGTSLAQPTKAAEALFAEGRAAMDQKDYETACTKFAESLRLDAAIGTEMNLANCEEQRGKIGTAWRLFRSIAQRISADDPRRAVAIERYTTLDGRVPRVRVTAAAGAPDDIQVRVGEIEIARTSFDSALPLDPGDYVVTVTIPGRAGQRKLVQLREGTVTNVSVPFEASPGAPHATKTPARAPQASSAEHANDDRFLGLDRGTATYVAFGIGGAGLLVGTVAGLIGLQQESVADLNCNDATKTCNQRGFDANASSRTMATISTIGFAIGILGAGAGTYVLLSSSREPDGARALSAQMGGTW